MNAKVLIPELSKPWFRPEPDLGIEPIFYRTNRESIIGRLLRKAGLRNTRQQLEARLGIERGWACLERVIALWLSPDLHLPPAVIGLWLDRLPELKWVFSPITGTEHLDLDLFKRRGVWVSNAGDLASRRVAEMALACILSHAKRLPEHIELQRKRRWQGLPTEDFSRQTVGVIGTGNIGYHLAGLCRALGMKVLGASRQAERWGQNPLPYDEVVPLHGGLDRLLAESDHVVIALPLNDQTRGLLSWRELAQMKKSASIINVARGPIISETDLCRALVRGQIAAAYIDRPTSLPLSRWSPLYRAPHLVLTHYSAAASPRHWQTASDRFLQGLRQVIQSREPRDRVA